MGAGRFDLIVVGAGVIGAMTALLARRARPEWRIALVDRSLVGHGATQYSAFMDFPFGATERIRRLSARSAELYDGLRAELPALPIAELPMYGVCSAASQARFLECLSAAPARPSVIHEDVLARALPGFALPGHALVLSGLTARRCVDRTLTERLVEAFARTERSVCVEGLEVERVAAEGSGVAIVARDGRQLLAARAALCLGPWLTRGVAALAQEQVAVRVKKVASLHVPLVPPEGAPLLYLFEHEAFFLPQPERRRWLFSFRSEHWDCAPEATELRLEADDWERARAILALHAPGGLPEHLGGRVFCDGYGARGEPHVAPLQRVPRCLVVGGCSGSGYRLAPAVAEEAVARLSQDV